MKRPWWRRRWALISAAIVLLLILIVLLGPVVARPFVRAKLQALLRQQLDADVQIGGLGYWPPYTVTVDQLRVTTSPSAGNPIDLFWAKRLKISLDRSPFASGPLVIKRIDVEAPSVHLIRTADGFVGVRGIAPPANSQKLSDLFQCRHAEVRDADVTYDDRTKPDAAPLVWRNMNLSAASAENAPGDYNYEAGGDNGKGSTFSAAGTINIDSPRVHLERCAMQLKLDPPTADSPLPAQLQSLLKQYRCGGRVALELKGDAPLAGAGANGFLNQVKADVHVLPQGLTVQPPGMSQPLADFADLKMQIENGSATVESLRAGCGDDSLYVEKAVASLRDLPDAIRVDHFAGCAVLGRRHPTYPSPISDGLAQADVRGPFWFDGSAAVTNLSKDQPALDYNVHVKTDRGAISSVRYHIPLRNVNLDAVVTPKSADLKQFAADTLSGKVTSTGHADLGDAISYTARLHVQRIDLNGLARVAVNPGEKPITVSGELSAEISVSGKGTGPAALDALGAFGNVQVTKGDLFHVPVLKDIASAIDLGEAATVSEASCSFNLAQRKIQVSDAVVNSPALGVKGGGVVGLDGSLDLNVIANVLSDWEGHIKEINNPVANVVGSVAGAVQRGVNKVTETLLYQLHVTGTVDKPQVKVITAPALRRK